MKTIRSLAILAAGAFCIAASVSAQTLYKLIDKNGKVTYSEEKPKNFDGQVIPLTIDPNANTATLPKPAAAPGKGGEVGEMKVRSRGNMSDRQRDAEARYAQAKEKLESSKKALQDAKDNPGPDDMMMVGKVGGGVRNIPSEEYEKRLAKLEQDVKDAEDELARAEKDR
ncbi:MAG TPA: DUF4124 domain-containing protein [Usitatibacter sp.]|nr:DUF4124 domain-containing protein [Usitatibacter sp.]